MSEPPEVLTLVQLRRRAGVPPERMAKWICMDPEALALFEQANGGLQTLRHYVEALGARLRIQVTLRDEVIELDLNQ